MSDDTVQQARDKVDEIYRAESRQVLATLIRLLGDFDLAEDALHDAFRAALEQWPRDGVPANPRAWLISVGRFKAIDARLKAHKVPYNGPIPQLPGLLGIYFHDPHGFRLEFACQPGECSDQGIARGRPGLARKR